LKLLVPDLMPVIPNLIDELADRILNLDEPARREVPRLLYHDVPESPRRNSL
jgi:hypothetical protein